MAVPSPAKGQGFIRALMLVIATIMLVAAGGSFRFLQPPIGQSHGKITEVNIVYTRVHRINRTEFIVKVDGGQYAGMSIGFAASGTDKHFFVGEYVALSYKPGGEILEAEFRDPHGLADGHYRSNLVTQPYVMLFLAALFLWLGLKLPGRGSKTVMVLGN